MKNKDFINAIDAIDIITIADKSKENVIMLTAETYRKNDNGNIEMVKYKMHLKIKKENKYTALFKKLYRSCKLLHDKAQAIKILNLFYLENRDRLLCDIAVIPTEESKMVYDNANLIFTT